MGIWAKEAEESSKTKRRNSRFLAALRMTNPDWERDAQAGVPVSLVGRGVVTGFGVDGERREALRRTEFDLDFAPASVVRAVAWSVSEHILVTQLHADLGRDVRQII